MQNQVQKHTDTDTNADAATNTDTNADRLIQIQTLTQTQVGGWGCESNRSKLYSLGAIMTAPGWHDSWLFCCYCHAKSAVIVQSCTAACCFLT